MNSSTVNISFNKNLLKQIDKIAKQESRTRSELIREAARFYIERKSKWQDIFNFAQKQTANKKLNESDVIFEIKKFRNERDKTN